MILELESRLNLFKLFFDLLFSSLTSRKYPLTVHTTISILAIILPSFFSSGTIYKVSIDNSSKGLLDGALDTTGVFIEELDLYAAQYIQLLTIIQYHHSYRAIQ